MNELSFGLEQENIDKIHEVLETFPNIEKVIIYGSRAKGNYKKGSDIDLTLMGSELTTEEQLNLMWQLDELLLPYTFDLSLFKSIDNEALIGHINRIGKTFYERSVNS